ncbi:uncharacterized protein LOC108106971 [Drosophila eugracilis]|uniref:uncharacterized protein LOC108106971 n=1 Tax=Drosophila eugracilis TaxID=29029 RepID=UPI001BDA46B4|nr:uncharacterized protein LOC108106971 [Drosophila eugracilis]
MEQFFGFPASGMGLGLVQMPQCEYPIPGAMEYSLNPNAVEFVPSYRQKPEFPSTVTKTEATSTTTLLHPGMLGDAVDHAGNGLHVRQIFELLSQLGDEQMPLEEVSVGLLPGGQGLSMTFTTNKPGQLPLPDSMNPFFHKNHSLQLAVGDQEKVASRPESVLVAQFLIRVNDLLNEKYEYGGDASVCPRCTLCSNRSYTELEIENQIEGIKAFENFFTFTESTRYQDLVSHKAFKELCRKLGLIVSRDQIHINRVADKMTTVVPPPTAQPSAVTVSKDVMEPDAKGDAYAGDDESRSNEGELTPRGNPDPSMSTEYVRGKLYRYEDSEGSQLVNELNEAQQSTDSMIVDDFNFESASSSPIKSVVTTSMPASFPRLYKSAKAKCTGRGAGPSGVQSSPQPHRSSGYARSVVRPAQVTPNTMEKCRSAAVGGHFQGGSSASRKMESCPPGAARKQNRLTIAKSGCVYQQPGNMTGVASGRVGKQGKPGNTIQKQQANHIGKSGKSSAPSRMGIPNSKQNQVTSQRMIPRSTNASMMRQTEVKRRMSLMRGDSDTDLLYNEYLFK